MMLKKQNSIRLLSVIIIIITLIISTKIISTNLKKSEKYYTEINELNIISEQNVVKSDIKSTDYEIAKILFSCYFEDEFNETLITEAFYNNEDKEFSCTYVKKVFDEFYEKDYVEIRTSDFVTYSYTSVENIYDEDKDMNIPHSWNSTYTAISNELKSKIITLAQSEGYYTSKNLSNEDYKKILDIIFENDINDLQKIIEKNDYILKNNYLSQDRIYYLFTQKNNEENYIEISSWISGVMGWNVYGASNKSIYNDSYYSDISEAYIIDFDIKINENLSELENIYNLNT